MASSSSLARSTPSNARGRSPTTRPAGWRDPPSVPACAARAAALASTRCRRSRSQQKRVCRAASAREDVGAQPAVAGAGFDQVEGVRRSSRGVRPSRRSVCEQLAEDRADIDAGKKIARPPGTLGGAGVVAELGMVERQVHERGHREGAAFTDDLQSAIANLIQRSAICICNRHSAVPSIPSSPSRTPRCRRARQDLGDAAGLAFAAARVRPRRRSRRPGG